MDAAANIELSKVLSLGNMSDPLEFERHHSLPIAMTTNDKRLQLQIKKSEQVFKKININNHHE